MCGSGIGMFGQGLIFFVQQVPGLVFQILKKITCYYLYITILFLFQIGGVRFLYDNLVECLNRFKTSSGFGCILAHSMGLGKTIQMIGFIDIFLRNTGAKTVMVIVPINTLANWMSEFNMWVPDKETCEKYNIPDDVTPRPYDVYMLNDLYKNTPARAKVVGE